MGWWNDAFKLILFKFKKEKMIRKLSIYAITMMVSFIMSMSVSAADPMIYIDNQNSALNGQKLGVIVQDELAKTYCKGNVTIGTNAHFSCPKLISRAIQDAGLWISGAIFNPDTPTNVCYTNSLKYQEIKNVKITIPSNVTFYCTITFTS